VEAVSVSGFDQQDVGVVYWRRIGQDRPSVAAETAVDEDPVVSEIDEVLGAGDRSSGP